MEAERAPIDVTLFQPVLAVDAVEGRWFAVVSDGQARVEVLEWPLWDQRFEPEASAVFCVELFLAADAAEFLRGGGRCFAQLHVPVAEVRAAGAGGLVRTWFGLQRGQGGAGALSSEEAARRCRASRALAWNLLTPKLCCSFAAPGGAAAAVATPAGRGGPGGAWGRSVLEHSNMIMNMHNQLRALWAQGRLFTGELASGDFVVQLADVSAGLPGWLSASHTTDAETICSLQTELQQLRETLDEGRHALPAHEERLEVHRWQAAAEQSSAACDGWGAPCREPADGAGAALPAPPPEPAAPHGGGAGPGPEGEQTAAELRRANLALAQELGALREQEAEQRRHYQEALAQAAQELGEATAGQLHAQARLHSAKEAQRDAERGRSAALDAARGEMEEQRSTSRAKVGQLRDQLKELQDQNLELRGELHAERRAPEGACAQEEAVQEPSAREREARLRGEIHDLEDANDELARQAQRQFDEMAALQERVAQEILLLRREREGGEPAVDLAAALATNEQLRAELAELRGAERAEERPEGLAAHVERRIAHVEAHLRQGGRCAAVGRRRADAPARGRTAGSAAPAEPPGALGQARDKAASADPEPQRLGARGRAARESRPGTGPQG